jgi:hypothetical protein
MRKLLAFFIGILVFTLITSSCSDETLILQSDLYGDWYAVNGGVNVLIFKMDMITLNEDGTCVIGKMNKNTPSKYDKNFGNWEYKKRELSLSFTGGKYVSKYVNIYVESCSENKLVFGWSWMPFLSWEFEKRIK